MEECFCKFNTAKIKFFSNLINGKERLELDYDLEIKTFIHVSFNCSVPRVRTNLPGTNGMIQYLSFIFYNTNDVSWVEG